MKPPPLPVDPPTVPIPRGMRLCTVRGCYLPHAAGGYCSMHAQRVARWGSPDVTLLRGTP